MLNEKVKIVLGIILLTGVVSGNGSAAGVGTTGAQFLKIGVGARPVSMGHAFSAVADDVNAIYWNPAGLAIQEDTQVSASYMHYFQDVKIGFLGYSTKCMKGTLGVGVNYLAVSGFEKRRLTSDGGVGDADDPEGEFGAMDTALYLSYARKEIKGIDMGLNLKTIYQRIDDESAISFALDIALLYRKMAENLNLSFGLYNLGTNIKFVDEGDPMPILVRAGASYRMLDDKLVLVTDIDGYIVDRRLYACLGAEYSLVKALSFRTGYKYGMDSELGGMAGLSAGAGFNIWNVQMDYAFVPFGELGNTHRISVGTKF